MCYKLDNETSRKLLLTPYSLIYVSHDMAQVVGCGEIRRLADESQLFSMTVAICCVCMCMETHAY